ncbi:hypothetical protein PFLUV_G00253720 [Perca fluviatilis]|uniref:Serpin B6 n=1 Tax=Perca fluviatilis TaxID=8168 RepID=A0A6A5E3W3_PERFL|nr:hypothetical protein PFLUV_G00253720 [Perca fluviatilis]
MASPTPLSKANTTFSLALLKKFGDDDKTANIFYSPFSISSALAMVMLGARGNTATQMSECLKTKDCQDDVHVSFAQLLSELNKAGAPYALSVANRLYGEQSYQFDEGDVDSLSRLVLVNAMYFKSDWNRQFQQYATRDAQFRLNKNDTKPVKMMHQRTRFPFSDIPNAKCKLEKQLTYENFMEWTRPDMMDNVEVQVGLPRFKMEESYDMKEVLVSMGMVDAFDMAKSDLSGMSPANDLVVSKVVHKAFVEVNEEGTEAAAVTGPIMRLLCGSIMCPPMFIADHPFLFFIRHNSSMSILFAGRCCSPE